MSEALVTTIELLATELERVRLELRVHKAESQNRQAFTNSLNVDLSEELKEVTKQRDMYKSELETVRREISVHEQEYQKLLAKVGNQ